MITEILQAMGTKESLGIGFGGVKDQCPYTKCFLIVIFLILFRVESYYSFFEILPKPVIIRMGLIEKNVPGKTFPALQMI